MLKRLLRQVLPPAAALPIAAPPGPDGAWWLWLASLTNARGGAGAPRGTRA